MRLITLIAVLVAGIAASTAIPPRPIPYSFINSEGDTISILIHGAPFAHTYTLAADGTPLVRRGNLFYLPQTSADGNIEASPYEVTPQLSDEARAHLSTIDLAETGMRLRARAASEHPQASRSSATTLFPSEGEIRSLAIIVEYADVKLRISNPLEHFTRMLNEPGFTQDELQGSARDYFIDSSRGRFTPRFDVAGPVTLPRERAYYGANGSSGEDLRAYEMAVDACRLLDGQIDFSQYDYDADGCIDNVYIFYAGESEADGPGVSADCVWPHSYDIDWMESVCPSHTRTFDGKRLNHYACSSEWQAEYTGIGPGRPDGIGSFVHEFSHVLGLPDLYSTSGEFYDNTPGSWSVLDVGCYLPVPPAYSAYERMYLGWLEPEELTQPSTVTLDPLRESARALRISTTDPDEYFILETRDREGWDRSLPGHGLLIWHIDYDPLIWDYNMVNNDPDHQNVDLVRADNNFSQTEPGMRSDPFPGHTGCYTSCTSLTHKAYRSWCDNTTDSLPLTDIRRSGPDGCSVTFKIAGGDSDTDAADLPLPDADRSGETLYDLRGIAVDRSAAAPGLYLLRAADGTVTKVAIR